MTVGCRLTAGYRWDWSSVSRCERYHCVQIVTWLQN